MVFSWPHEAFEATFGASGLRAVKGPILWVRPANLNPVPPESSTNAPPPPLLPSLPHLPLSLPCHCTIAALLNHALAPMWIRATRHHSSRPNLRETPPKDPEESKAPEEPTEPLKKGGMWRGQSGRAAVEIRTQTF